MTILLLGGTAEADQLADRLTGHGVDFIYSLAGVTMSQKPRVYPLRTGGFGGVAGLARYLAQNAISMVVDATHPFAVSMSKNAHAASIQANIAILRFERPEWQQPEGASWQYVPNLEAAALALPAGSRVFLSVGAKSMAAFAFRNDVDFISRVIQPPRVPFGKIIVAKPPFDVAGETRLFEGNAITHLVSKNAGGNQTSAKLVAAQNLDIQVIMVERPQTTVAEVSRDVDATMAWIERRL